MIRTNLIEDLTLIPLPAWWQSPWAMGGFVLLAVALAGLFWGLRRWLASRPVPEAARPPEPDRTPEFLARLESLKGRRDVLSPHDFALERRVGSPPARCLGGISPVLRPGEVRPPGATPDEESRLVETAATFVRKGGGR